MCIFTPPPPPSLSLSLLRIAWCANSLYRDQEQLKKAEELFMDLDIRRQQLKLGVDQLEDRLQDVQVSYRWFM